MPTPRDFGRMHVDTKGAALITGYSEQTLRCFRSREVGPPYIKTSSRVFYETKALKEWLAKQYVKVSPKKNKK